MHAKTDSDATSLATTTSPSRSPTRTRPVYYVQSPSHDGEKTTTATSFDSTPAISPMGSPPHSSVSRHSRESSTSRFSGSRKTLNDDATRKKQYCDVIEEEGLLGDQDGLKGVPKRCYFLVFVLGFFVLFSLFSFILWGASKPQKPKIIMKSIKFERFSVQAGSDGTGVATDMISVNSTVKFNYRNTGTFFRTHVTSTPIELSYEKITIASGSLKKFHQSRKSHRLVSVVISGSRIPLYGSGGSLSSPKGVPTLPVHLKLSFTVRSRAYVLGRLVKTKFYKRIECSVTYDPEKLNKPISLKKSCTYD